MSKNKNLPVLKQLIKNPAYNWDRKYHLAYALLRGRKIEQIESPNSNPHTFPSAKSIADTARGYHRSAAEGVTEAEHVATVEAFCSQIVADLEAWKRKLYMNWLVLEAKRRSANAVKRSAGPRIHTPRPAKFASRGA